MSKKLLALVLGTVAATTFADTLVWIGGSGGKWSDSSNWESLTTDNTSIRMFTNSVTFAEGDTQGSNFNTTILITNTMGSATVSFQLHGNSHTSRHIQVFSDCELHLHDSNALTLDPNNGELVCDTGGSIFCHAPNALPSKLYRIKLSGAIDLGGHDQTFEKIGVWTIFRYGQTITSQTPAMLRFSGSIPEIQITGYVKGYAGICWKPDREAAELKFYNYNSDTKGALIVSNGIVNLNKGSSRAQLTKLSRLELCENTKLIAFDNSSVSTLFAEQFVVHQGAKVILGGEGATSATAKLPRVMTADESGRETDLVPGIYGEQTGDGIVGLDWLEGNSFLQVVSSKSQWKTSISGNWDAEGNWTLGVPSATKEAGIEANGGDYAVTIDKPTAVTNLTVRNLYGNGTATLNVSSELSAIKSKWNIGKGGRILVDANGRVEYCGTNAAVTSAFSSSDDVLEIANGGILEIRGKMTVTNLSGRLVLGGSASESPSRIIVADNGELVLHSVKSKTSYILNDSGRIEVSGNGLLRRSSSQEHYSWKQTGGALDFSGNATYDVSSAWDTCISSGTSVFRENSKLTGKAARVYLAGNAGYLTEISFLDNAAYSVGKDSITEIRPSGGRVAMRFDSDATHSLGYFKLGRSAYNGDIDIYLSKGTLHVDGSAGLIQGGASVYFNTDCFTTSTVHQTGGTLRVNGSDGASEKKTLKGFILGDGLTSAAKREPSVKCVYNLSGGTVTNENTKSVFVLGVGRGHGEIIQTGGEFISLATHANAPAVFGFSNGYGYYTLSNGTAKISSKIWVGGIDHETFGHYGNDVQNPSYAGTEAVGKMTIAAADLSKPCSFTAMDTVVLGGLGEGALEIGPGGSFSGTDLVLSNNTASVLRYTISDSGAGRVDLSGKLTITDGASLVVDASSLSVGTALERLRILSCADVEGSFAPGKITFTAPDPSKYKLSVNSSGICLSRIKGTAIVIR